MVSGVNNSKVRPQLACQLGDDLSQDPRYHNSSLLSGSRQSGKTEVQIDQTTTKLELKIFLQ